LALWLSDSEGAKFWLGCLTDLENRGLNDILIVCINGLTGFADAIHGWKAALNHFAIVFENRLPTTGNG
jgi:hypothetical protein